MKTFKVPSRWFHCCSIPHLHIIHWNMQPRRGSGDEILPIGWPYWGHQLSAPLKLFCHANVCIAEWVRISMLGPDHSSSIGAWSSNPLTFNYLANVQSVHFIFLILDSSTVMSNMDPFRKSFYQDLSCGRTGWRHRSCLFILRNTNRVY